MFEQISNPFIAATKQFAEAGFKAQGIALEGFEKVVGAQINTFENRLNATLDFWSQASEVRNLDGVKAIMPKSVALAKETAETVFATTQEVVGITVKTGEALNAIVKTQIDASNDVFVKPVAAAARKGK
jgi:phasin family protein